VKSRQNSTPMDTTYGIYQLSILTIATTREA
jgi:hypothetical protein